MTLKNIAVVGCVFQIIPVVPSDGTIGIITPGPNPITKVKASSKFVYANGYSVFVSGITAPGAGAITPDPLTYTAVFASSALKVKAEGSFVLLEGDESAVLTASPLMPGTPGTPYPTSFKVKIVSAGQVKVRAQ